MNDNPTLRSQLALLLRARVEILIDLLPWAIVTMGQDNEDSKEALTYIQDQLEEAKKKVQANPRMTLEQALVLAVNTDIQCRSWSQLTIPECEAREALRRATF
jgi:hypothetical protein